MNILLLTKFRGAKAAVRLDKPRAYLSVFMTFSLLVGTIFYAGYMAGRPDSLIQSWQKALVKQKRQIQSASTDAQLQIDALAVRLGQMQAQVVRLEALGQRLTKMADLDQGEFNFAEPPAVGGPINPDGQEPLSGHDFLRALSDLAGTLDDREQQLTVLERLMTQQSVDQKAFPAGMPVESPLITSYFGMRTDPFTGHRDYHAGVDFSGQSGADVLAVADGVVVASERRPDYGNVVDVQHGNGYVTRYGHNRENLVKVGEAVKKGQVIAMMGSTGRSTGTHVHFEVLRDGKNVNPKKFLEAAR